MKLRHGRVSLELHERSAGEGTALLLLHELGGSAADFAGDLTWPGPVFALDFSGHGASGRVRGGGYTPELLVADADVALAQLGSAALLGCGLGAYVALLLAGARHAAVPAALLLPGEGLVGGGESPESGPALADAALRLVPDADPDLAALAIDVRPADYAAELASEAQSLLFAEGVPAPPPWWVAARKLPRARGVAGDLASGLALLREVVSLS